MLEILDTHSHIVSDDVGAYPPTPVGGVRSQWSKEHGVTAEQFIHHLPDAGVSRALIVHSSTTYGFDNSYAADSVQRYPDRFVGVCAVDGAAPDAPERLRYWIQERGMSGVRFYPRESDTWLDQPEGYPIWEAAEQLGIPVNISGRRVPPSVIKGVAKRFSRVPILLDHMLNPAVDDGIPFEKARPVFDLVEFPNVYFKFTSINLKRLGDAGVDASQFIGAVLARFGAERVMWGSNFPSSYGTSDEHAYKELVQAALLAAERLNELDRSMLFSGTAKRLYAPLSAAAAR